MREFAKETITRLAQARVEFIGGYEQIIGQTDEMEIAGGKVRVLSLSQLIASKTAAGRPKDLAVLPVLQAALELQQKQSPPPRR